MGWLANLYVDPSELLIRPQEEMEKWTRELDTMTWALMVNWFTCLHQGWWFPMFFFTIFGMMIPMTTYRKGVETADQEFFWDFLFNFRCSPWLGDNTRACHFSGPLKAGSMCSSLRWCQSITCVLHPPSLNEKVMDSRWLKLLSLAFTCRPGEETTFSKSFQWSKLVDWTTFIFGSTICRVPPTAAPVSQWPRRRQKTGRCYQACGWGSRMSCWIMLGRVATRGNPW